MFCREDSSPIDPVFARHVAELRLPELHFHGLRHTHATLGLKAGIHPKVMAERLRHHSAAFTQDIYVHALEGLQQEAASRMARLVFGRSPPG